MSLRLLAAAALVVGGGTAHLAAAGPEEGPEWVCYQGYGPDNTCPGSQHEWGPWCSSQSFLCQPEGVVHHASCTSGGWVECRRYSSE